MKGGLKQFFHVASELSVEDGLLLRGNRIVIPMALCAPVMNRLHGEHLGINKCRDCARESVWWPGLKRELEVKISMCTKCTKSHSQKPAAEPLMMSNLPDLPWQKVAIHLFSWNSSQYLLVIYYFFLEMWSSPNFLQLISGCNQPHEIDFCKTRNSK